MHYADDHFLFPLVREPRSRWERAGLSPRQERRVSLALNLLVLLFVAGWAYTIVLRLTNPRPAIADGADTPVLGSGSAFEDPNAPPTIAQRLGRGGIAPALTAELLRALLRLTQLPLAERSRIVLHRAPPWWWFAVGGARPREQRRCKDFATAGLGNRG